MTQKNERRSCGRQHVQTPVVYTTNKNHEYYYATMYNYSSKGMYFKSTSPLKKGCDIYIKIETNSECNTHKKMSDDYKAKVIWCKEVENSDIMHYAIGIQYYNMDANTNNNFIIEQEGQNYNSQINV